MNASGDVQSSPNTTTIAFDCVVGSLSKSLEPEDFIIGKLLAISQDSDTIESPHVQDNGDDDDVLGFEMLVNYSP